MGFNRIWYVMLCVALLLGLMSIGQFEYETLKLVARRWSWLVLISPSAYAFFTCMVQAIFLPIRAVRLIPTFFDRDEPSDFYRRRYLWTLGIVGGIVAAEFLMLIVIWGTFPLEVDATDHVRLRLIPFVPWPDREFLTIR